MLEFKNVYKRFDNPVIENLSFKLIEGERLAVLGESGIGKSTIINLILGIISPDSGEVTNNYGRISTVFQENRLVEEISAIQNLQLVTDKPESEIVEILKSLKIENPLELVKNLSGGMKRRVAIARALIYDADLYLLDEPIQGLDEDTRKTVISKILEITQGKSMILISHSMEDIRDFAIGEELVLR